jgi:hypothetical protein
MAIGQLVPLCLDGAVARFVVAVFPPDADVFDAFGFDADADFLEVDAFVDAGDDLDPARVRRFGVLSPMGSASPTAFTAPDAMSPTAPTTLPACRVTVFTTLPGSGMEVLLAAPASLAGRSPECSLRAAHGSGMMDRCRTPSP